MDSHGCNGRAVGKDLIDVSIGKDISFRMKQILERGTSQS